MARVRARLCAVVITAAACVVLPVTGVVSTGVAQAATGCAGAPSGVRFAAPGTGKTVALTFDDGPGRDTRRILAVLTANHVAATFFNMGINEARDPATERAEFAAGYALGDHTWDHHELPYLSAADQAGEMDRERVQQARVTGAYPCLFRPPYGSYDATTLTLAQRRGMSFWYWSVDTEDWKASGSGDSYWVDRITDRAEAGVSQLHPVILMHNQPTGNPATVAALPRIINFYRTHGYRFVDLLGRGAAPTIRSLSSTSGRTAGHERIRVNGTGFIGVRSVLFGRVPGTALHVVSATSLLVTSPRHVAALAQVRVVGTFGTSALTARDRYTFVRPPTVTRISPASGPTKGGTRILVRGTDFRNVTAVLFGRLSKGTQIHVAPPSMLYVTAPAHSSAVVGIRVVTRYGTSAEHPADRFTYVAPPAITSVSPADGTVDGGTAVTITGTGLAGVTAVRFGDVVADFAVVSDTSLTVVTPAHAAGSVDIRVTDAYGTSAVVAAGTFTFS